MGENNGSHPYPTDAALLRLTEEGWGALLVRIIAMESLQRRFFLSKDLVGHSHSYSASNEAAVGRRPARPSASGRGRNPFSCGRMTTLRLGSTACSAFLSRDRRPSSSYGHSAPLRALASCGGGEAVLGFSFRPNKRSPMTLASPSRSARAARFVASSQDHGDGSSSERYVLKIDLLVILRSCSLR